MDAATSFLVKLAMQSAATWHALSARTFPGELSIETANGIYRFKNAVFLSRAERRSRTFDAPRAMRGMRLIGYLADEGGFFSLSPRWREGARAVLWRPGEIDGRSFLLTSATVAAVAEESSGVVRRLTPRAPSVRRLPASSLTRLHASVPAQSAR